MPDLWRDADMTNNLALREKAYEYLTKNNLDGMLAGLYFYLTDSPYQAKDDDFSETTSNLGLTKVSKITKTVDIEGKPSALNFTYANFKGINFEYGISFSEFYTGKKVGIVFLFIDEKLVVNFSFHGDVDYYCWDDYALHEIYELHATPKLEELLFGMLKEKEIHEKKIEEQMKREENAKYEGKFSLGEETESKTEIKPAETQTPQQSSNDSTSYQLGKMFGKLFK